MNVRKVNWPGFPFAASLMVLLYLSFAYKAPWWQLRIADGIGYVAVSPLDVDIMLMGVTINVPIIWYLTLGSKLTLLLVAAILSFYLTNPRGTHSKKLLDAIYKKPVYMVVGMVLISTISKLIYDSFLPFKIPIVGTSTTVVSSQGVTLSVPITTTFTWVFWLAILSACLALATRVYHGKTFPARQGDAIIPHEQIEIEPVMTGIKEVI